MPEIQIADKTTLDAVKVLIGANNDAAGMATLFARLSQIMADESVIKTGIGGRTAHTGTFSTTSSTLQTAVNVTGKGDLTGLTFYDASGYPGRIVLTVDGTVLLDRSVTLRGGSVYVAETGLYIGDNAGVTAAAIHVEFKSSLLIQICSTNGTNARSVGWLYNA